MIMSCNSTNQAKSNGDIQVKFHGNFGQFNIEVQKRSDRYDAAIGCVSLMALKTRCKLMSIITKGRWLKCT